MNLPTASLSLDLDNHWAYLRSLGLPEATGKSAASRSSYLPEIVPRIVDFLGERNLPCTFFVVGKDFQDDKDCDAIRLISAAGHEIANHSQSHFPWMHTLSIDQQEQEVADAETVIEQLTGSKPLGFRAPGFSWSPELLSILARRGYRYDASVFPTAVGPLTRMYCRFKGIGNQQSDTKNEDDAQSETVGKRPEEEGPSSTSQRFSTFSDALRNLKPHPIQNANGPLIELPVTTMPITRAPIHFTYLAFLAEKSPRAARAYWNLASRLCRLRGVGPSLLLHPLDFMGPEEAPSLSVLPGMRLQRTEKLELLSDVLSRLAKRRQVVSLAEHALASKT